jgi:hypothetical protein
LASAEVGGVVLVIDAKNERVARWYAGYGAVPLLDAPLSVLLPLATMEAALKAPESTDDSQTHWWFKVRARELQEWRPSAHTVGPRPSFP